MIKLTAILTLITSLGFISPAIAEPPTGSYVPRTGFIVCDTRDQMNDIVQSIRDNKLQEKLMELSKITDSAKEPVCAYGQIGPLIFDNSDHIGIVVDHDRTVDMWISSVHNEQTPFFLLWGELIPSSAT